MKSTFAWSAAFLAVLLVSGCRREEKIQTYTAPKEPGVTTAQATMTQAPSQPGAMSMNAADAPQVAVNSAPIHWTTPAGWTQLAPTSIRIGNFSVPGPAGKTAAVTITSFPGDVGGELANVNRWRREVGLTDVTENEIHSDAVTVDGTASKLYNIAGATERTVVAIVMRDGNSWFFKIRGDKDVVASAQPAYTEFLKSIHFGASTETAAATPPSADPAGVPKLTVPAHWTEGIPGPMVVKTYSIPGDAGKSAKMSISVLGGAAGGTLPNVNRWRGQMTLPDVTDDGLAQIAESLDTPGGKALIVDFAGTDGKTGQPSRLVAAIVPRGDQTWFYKLTGDGALVGREKSNFRTLVQTAAY